MDKLRGTILTLELAALERWNGGDPDGYLDLYDEDMTYFDPSLEARIDGRENMVEYYEAARGKIKIDRYEMIKPSVQPLGEDGAVLTFHLESFAGENLWRWNCTEVYRRRDDGSWKIAHNHWSLIKPLGDKEI